MSTRPSSGSYQQAWWAVVAAVVAVVMVLKPAGKLTVGEWKWVVGVAGVVMMWRVMGLWRSSSSSPGRILLLVVGVAVAGSVAVVGIPVHWLRLPAWSEVASVVMPLVLGGVALMAILFGVAGLNRRREMDGAPQRSYVPLILNLIIVAAAWQVVRQPLWKESLQGMMRLPQLRSNRMAFEHSVEPWMEIIQHGEQRQSGAAGPTGTASGSSPGPAGRAHGATSRMTVLSTHPLGGEASRAVAPKKSMATTPSTAEQWIQAAVHNSGDPLMELNASIALVADGRSDQALGRLAAAKDRGCQSPDLIRYHARLLRAKERPAAAAAVLEALVVSPQGTDEDLDECLRDWEHAGQIERAESLAERLLVKRPSRDLFRWLATRDAAQGRHERALVLLGQLSRRTPFEPADAFQLAEVALQAGRPEIALDAVSLIEGAGHRSARSNRLAQRARASAMVEPPPPSASLKPGAGG